MASENASTTLTSNANGGENVRVSNIQRVSQKKQLVKSYPKSKKLEKLAVYSSCKVCTSLIPCNNKTQVRPNIYFENTNQKTVTSWETLYFVYIQTKFISSQRMSLRMDASVVC